MTKFARAAVLLLATFAPITAGCGGGGSSDTTAGATTAAAGTDTAATATGAVTATDVATGLAAMVATAADAAAKTATDAGAGKTAAAALEPSWAPIEDVVKANEPDTYIDIEDAMALLESGDATKAADGATRLTTAVAGYVAKYPG
jgi:hypothetical protein